VGPTDEHPKALTSIAVLNDLLKELAFDLSFGAGIQGSGRKPKSSR
jgi:hypothetical protein